MGSPCLSPLLIFEGLVGSPSIISEKEADLMQLLIRFLEEKKPILCRFARIVSHLRESNAFFRSRFDKLKLQHKVLAHKWTNFINKAFKFKFLKFNVKS